MDARAVRRAVVRRRRQVRRHVRLRRRARARRGAGSRDRHRRDGRSGRRHPARARVLCPRQARRDGQRRGRCARGSAPRAACARGRHRVLARLRRPAGARLRDGRLVPRGGVRGGRGRQGHEVPARISRVDARHRLALLRVHSGDGRRRRLQRADVQLVPRRNEERDRDGGRRQRHGTPPGPRRPRVSALRRRRPAARAPSARCGRLASPRRAGGGDLERRARRSAGVPRPALGCLRDVSRGRRLRRGLRAAVLPRVRLLDRSVGPLLGDVQAVSRDRPRARHQRRLGRLERRADRRRDWLERRRRGGRQARPRCGRDARRRGRLHGLRQARAGARVARARCASARSRARCEARAAGRRARTSSVAPTSRSIPPPTSSHSAPRWKRRFEPEPPGAVLTLWRAARRRPGA